MNHIEAMKQAMEDLMSALCDPDGNVCWHGSYADRDIIGDALAVFRTAIEAAQSRSDVAVPEEHKKQEPVAWLIPGTITTDPALAKANGDKAVPLGKIEAQQWNPEDHYTDGWRDAMESVKRAAAPVQEPAWYHADCNDPDYSRFTQEKDEAFAIVSDKGGHVTELYTRAQPAPAPKDMVLLPKRMTQAMRDVTDQEDWAWEDLLAAAEAITEDEYNEIATPPAAQPAPVNRDAQEAPFEEWWEQEGQFGRAGGGQYEKTFAWNAWCAALATPPAQPAVPLTDGVTVPLAVLEAAEASLGSFCSDHGWSDEDMQSMDNLSAYIARHKAARSITKGKP